jgi:phospholipid/cholesterol/gamma-HCH transport system substrate-binding protein
MSRAFRLGIFIVAALLVFAGGVFLIGKNQMLFRSKYRLNAEFRNVAGLAGGAEVRVAGIQKGTVRRIDLPQSPDKKARVEMELDSATRKLIRKDSTAAIHTEGLMGDEYVEIYPGTDNAPPVQANDTVGGAPPVEISDLIKKADGILDQAGGAMQNVSQTAGNLGSITSKINDGAGTIGALVNDKKIYQNVNQATAELQEDAEAAKHNFLMSHFFHKRGYEDSADLTKNEIAQLPSEPATKRFTWQGSKIFTKDDTAKLKDTKALNVAGTFLQTNPFGLAVVTGYSDKGDSIQEKTLTEARAMVVRDYLVKNFKMDDTRVKTIGLGKSTDADGSGVALLIYSTAPAGTNVTSNAHSPQNAHPSQTARK